MADLKVHRDGRPCPLLLVAGAQQLNLSTQLAFLHSAHPLDPATSHDSHVTRDTFISSPDCYKL